MFYSHCFAEAGESHSSVVCEKKKKKKKGALWGHSERTGLISSWARYVFHAWDPTLLSDTWFHQTQISIWKTDITC